MNSIHQFTNRRSAFVRVWPLACGLLLLLISPPYLFAGQQQRRASATRDAVAAASTVRAEMLVSTEWLAKHINDSRLVVLHVARDRAHYEQGHVPGARFVAWADITATRGGVPNELPPVAALQQLFQKLGIGDEGRIVLYGDNAGLSPARAYFTLDYLGHGHRATLLDGGIEKWRSERRTTSTESTAHQSAQFTPRVSSPRVVDLDVMRDLSWTAANIDAPNVTLLDARPAEEYTGVKPGDSITRGGHIPGAVNLFWMQHVVSRENPVLKPVAELRRLYDAAGVAPSRAVVTYCRTGGQSSHSYFVAKYLGYDVSMYDGSFFEWDKSTDAPVVSGEQRK